MASWYGWIIEQSLEDQFILGQFPTVKMQRDRPGWKEHVLEVPDEQVSVVVKFLEQHLRPEWYAHLVQGDRITVVFRGRAFDARQNEPDQDIVEYALSQGIPQREISLPGLFAQARREGF